MRRAKIVATLGPASDTPERLRELFRAGVDVVRLNFSHGTHEEHRARYQRVRDAATDAGRPIAILGDLSGPKIRVGRFPEGAIDFPEGKEFRLVFGDEPGAEDEIPHCYEPLARDVEEGQRIYLDDGTKRMRVVGIDGDAVRAVVEVGGTLKDKKGMNLPDTKLSTPALTDKDKKDLAFAKELGVDYLALSFVRSAEDMRSAKDLAGDTPVIAKIERPEAVEDLEGVLDACDGAMVARGDLGVEVGHEKVPAIQKRIIRECVRRAKPVITATQMLDSMISSPTPTRAEVSDVANAVLAVLDGSDAVMLSGETAVGEYPVITVETMASIIREIEQTGDHAQIAAHITEDRAHNFSAATAAASVEVADRLGLKALAVYSESGSSAFDVSSLRPKAAIVGFSRHPQVLQRLALAWGVHPMHGDWVEGVKGVVLQAEEVLLREGLVADGDEIAVTFSMKMREDEEFMTSTMKLHRVRAG
jgi:pyruvate kinase